MSSERISAWLEAQDYPSSPESDKIDHNEGFIEGYVVPRSNRDDNEGLNLAFIPVAKRIPPRDIPSSMAKGKQPATMFSSEKTNATATAEQRIKQQMNEHRLQTELDHRSTQNGRNCPPLSGLPCNSKKLSQTKACISQLERRRPPHKKRRMEVEQSNGRIMNTASKRNVSYDKCKEIPPTSSEPTTISSPAPRSTPPAAKRGKATYKGKEKEVIAGQGISKSSPSGKRRRAIYKGKERETVVEQLSSQESVHSPWRSIWRFYQPPQRGW